MKYLVIFLIMFSFLMNGIRSEELSNLQIKEISRKVFESFANNEEIKLDDRILSIEFKEYDYAKYLNDMKSKYHKNAKSEVKIEGYDQIAICNEILIDNAIFECSNSTQIIRFCYVKLNGDYKLKNVLFEGDIFNIVTLPKSIYKFESKFIEPELFKMSLPNLTDQTIEKIFADRDKAKITKDDIINELNTKKNAKIKVAFIGGIPITNSLNTCYYIIRKEKFYMIMNITYLNINNKTEILDIFCFNSLNSIVEAFNSFAVRSK